eukprot:UC1_evm1s678
MRATTFFLALAAIAVVSRAQQANMSMPTSPPLPKMPEAPRVLSEDGNFLIAVSAGKDVTIKRALAPESTSVWKMIDRIEQLKDTRLPALETRLMAHVSARIEKMRLRITSSSFTPALATMSANAEGHLAFAEARAKAWTEGDAVKREVDRQMGCLDTDASALLARVTAAGLRNAKLTTRTRQLDPLKLANAIINPIKNAATSALTSAANAAKSDFAKVVQASQSDFDRERKVIAEAPQYDARTYG